MFATTLAAQTPSPTTPQPTPAATITQPLANQPGPKPVSRRQARQADDAYLAGSALLDKNQPEKAQLAFERAAKLNPTEQKYTVAVAIARENVVSGMVRKSQVLRAAGDTAGADALLAAAAKLDPDNTLITEHMPQVEPRLQFQPYLPSAAGVLQPQFAQVLEFAPDATTQSFHFRADAHELLRRVLLAYGIKAQFNTDVPAQSVRLDIDDVTFQQIRPVLNLMTGTFLSPLDPRTALVIKDTEENHNQFDHLALENIYMPGFSTDQLHDAATMLQQVLDMQHVVVSTGSGTMTIRAPMDMMRIANYELADLLDGGSELLLDMKVYSIDKTNAKNIGLSMTTSVSAFSIASEATTIVNQYSTQIAAAIAAGIIPPGATAVQILEYLAGSGLLSGNALLTGLLGTVGGGLTYTGVTAGSLPSFNFGLNQSEAKSLEQVQLRVGDKKTATFRVGSKYPIITASYSAGGGAGAASLLAGLSSAQLAALGLNSSSAAALANTVSIPQIQYEDLGLTLKATPTVLRSGSISLNLDLKIEALAGTSLDDIPVLASRALTSNVTLMPGQAAMLATAMSRSESKAVTGIPGLSELPGFQDTTDVDKEVDTTELVITLTPRIVRRGHLKLAGIPLAIPHSTVVQEHNDD